MSEQNVIKKKKNKDMTDDDLKEEWSKFVRSFVPYDPRFPNTNQTRNCSQNYHDYYKCMAKKEDEDYCAWYKHAYKNLCPKTWIEHWDEQREKGIYPHEFKKE